jgi:hypothetical protein
MKRAVKRVVLFIQLSCCAAVAQGNGATPPSVASVHFAEGVACTQRGEIERALSHFRAAYSADPHYSVLYNIGQAEAALGRPLQAVEAFERYLEDGATHIGTERRQGVLGLIAANKKQIGQLRVIVSAPARTRVWLDGLELSAEQLSAPISLKGGEYTIIHSSGVDYPVSERVTVQPQEISEVKIGEPPRPVPQPAQLAISCRVPGVTVDVVGGPRLVTPIDNPVLVASGSRTVRFSRPGYRSVERALRIEPLALARVDCAQEVAVPVPPTLVARLDVRPSPVEARTFVDGRPFDGSLLPGGAHHLRVESDGFLPRDAIVSLAAGTTKTHYVTLEPTPERLAAIEQASARRRNWAYVLGGTSAALLLTSGALLLWNNDRFEDFKRGGAPVSDDLNRERAISIQAVDDLAIGMIIGGVISGVAAGFTWGSTDP